MSKEDDLIRTLYAAFNARDLETCLAAMQPEVDWPNGMEGGRVHGREGVREYWTRQWGMIDPTVEPRSVQVDEQGRIVVEVHQVVRDLAGAVVDQMVRHVYEVEDGLITRMEINPHGEEQV
jgi:ketosteroid isomerase-like protein